MGGPGGTASGRRLNRLAAINYTPRVRSFLLNCIAPDGEVIRSESFRAGGLTEAREYARARLPGCAKVEVWENGKRLFDIEAGNGDRARRL